MDARSRGAAFVRKLLNPGVILTDFSVLLIHL